MFYKHWKKIALSLTAFFWASCDETTTEAPMYGVPSCDSEQCGTDNPESSDSKGTPASSSETAGNKISSSSEAIKPESSSSSGFQPMPLYGVSSDLVTCLQKDDSTFRCVDGATCTRKTEYTWKSPSCHESEQDGEIVSICPDYGIMQVLETTYECDGKVYNEAEFRDRYQTMTVVNPPEQGSSSSGDVTCTPTDSSVAYFAQDYSADTQKMWKEQAAKHDAVDKIDSIKQTLAETPTCLENLRMELDMFMALYGAPTIINNAVETCSDGTTRPSEEYAKFLKMQEEWEANKSALDEELQKVYEDKMKEIEERINKCLSGETDK